MKQRLDRLLVERGLAPTIEKAQALIMAGQVLVDDQPVEKAGYSVSDDADLRLRGDLSRYVGRGGDKLEGALKHFQIDPTGLVALDVGASTGGFTDCLLQHGATKIYAVDVGHNQLDEKLRRDSRVVVLEKTHAKDLTTQQFAEKIGIVVVDVSFISVRKVMDFIVPLLAAPTQLLILVKPQFEAEREFVSDGGVVKDEAVQLKTVEDVTAHGISLGLTAIGFVPSALRGGRKGNQEYFVYFQRN